ncbi:PilW family protein [Uliginosibacterium paludis]|uniref:PilW family protein n=1 Tax=Uliginosibacterium paludis TaxID=1615952 RepID=A0ABV2CK31_9RHOO
MKKKKQFGLTLIELMVAMTIGLILLLALSSIYLSSQRTFRTADNLSRVQENVRIAFDVMSRDIRGTAFFGCAGQDGKIATVLQNSTDVFWNFLVPIYGYEASTGTSWNIALPTEITSTALGGRDVLITRSIDDGGGPVIAHAAATDALEIPTNSNIKAGDIVAVSNCANSTLLQVTAVTTSGDRDVLAHVSGSGTPGNTTADLGQLFSSGEVRPVSTKIYYISNNSNSIPSLYVRRGNVATPQEVVEGIDGMQILYGVDTNSDYFVDAYQTASQVETNNAWGNVISVRVTLTAVSKDDSVTSVAQSNATNSATDKRLRKEMTTTIALRNRAG